MVCIHAEVGSQYEFSVVSLRRLKFKSKLFTIYGLCFLVYVVLCFQRDKASQLEFQSFNTRAMLLCMGFQR